MMLDFQRYQLAFTAHIRNAKAHKKPAKVPDARMAIYRDIVFNNMLGLVSNCFPVCQATIGKRAWHKLVQQFMANYQATTPIFREIPQQFVNFLNDKNRNDTKLSGLLKIPVYLAQLAHYEWAELAIATQITETITNNLPVDLLNEKPVLTEACMLLEYDYPVHKISARFKPTEMDKIYLLVFRNSTLQVKFIELNAMTFKLLKLIKNNNFTGKQALTRLAEELQYADLEAMIEFGGQILADLAIQEAIIGSL